MVNLLIVNPTDNPLPTGPSINAPITVGIIALFNPTTGSGTLTSFTSSSAAANGSYGIKAATLEAGNFNVSVAQSGNNWQVSIGLTGTFAQFSTAFMATAAQIGDSVVFTNISNPQQAVTIAQDNGDTFTSGKVTVKLSTAPVTLYFMNR
jgi:hypothetical protein